MRRGRSGSRRGRGREALAGDQLRQPQRGVVLVDVARIRDEDRDRQPVAGRFGGERVKIRGSQPPALGPALAGDDEVTREHGADERVGRAPPGLDPFDAHPMGERWPRQRPSAASIARAV